MQSFEQAQKKGKVEKTSFVPQTQKVLSILTLDIESKGEQYLVRNSIVASLKHAV